MLKKNSSQKVTRKYFECGIIQQSKADKKFIKKHGKSQGKFLDKLSRLKCKYWDHVKCA